MFPKKAYKNFVILGDCGALCAPGFVYAGTYLMFKSGRVCLQLLLTVQDWPLRLASLILDVCFKLFGVNF